MPVGPGAIPIDGVYDAFCPVGTACARAGAPDGGACIAPLGWLAIGGRIAPASGTVDVSEPGVGTEGGGPPPANAGPAWPDDGGGPATGAITTPLRDCAEGCDGTPGDDPCPCPAAPAPPCGTVLPSHVS